MYEEDFVKEEIVKFDIDNKSFEYQPVTAGDELEWMSEYIEIDNKGNGTQNFSKLNKCKIRNLKSVPYNNDLINKIIGVNKEWKELNHENKWKLLTKLKPEMFNQIILKMNAIDKPSKKKS